MKVFAQGCHAFTNFQFQIYDACFIIYILKFRNCQKPVTNSNTLDEREPATGFAVIPYIQGVTETIKRILNSHNVKVAQKPFQTLGHIFTKPKDPVTKEQRTDAIYSIPCNDCDNE